MITSNQQDIEQKIKEILADKLAIPVENIKPDSSLIDDLGVDSFGTIEIMFEIEDTFKIKLDDSVFREAKVAEDIWEYVKYRIDVTEESK